MKEISKYLSSCHAYPWSIENDVCFRGYFLFDNILYKQKDAIRFLREHSSNIIELLPNFNGCFSIILEDEQELILAVDRLRTLPLFYRIDDSKICVSDTASKLTRSDDVIDGDSLNEFKKSILWVSGERTLIRDIYSVQAAECLFFQKKDSSVKKAFYFEMCYRDYYDIEQCKREFWPVYDSVGKELVQILNGRTAVIPLSGGADSRMVLDILQHQGYEKIICFTYGKRDSKEAMISKQVAEDRGCPWLFVEYAKDTHRKLLANGEYKKYWEYSGNYTSLPHLQDFAAVKHLTEKNLIPKDSVFIPGHSGDLLAGSHITYEFVDGEITVNNFKYWFRDKFYPAAEREEFLDKVPVRDLDNTIVDNESLLSVADTFNIKERQAKFIVNSIRTYEYFGYEWLIPLWSNQLMEYWSHVPLEERYKRKLYFECVGEDQVSSTNDSGLYKTISGFLHKNKILTYYSSKLKRIWDYFSNPLYFPQMFRFCDYLSCVIKLKGRFSINYMINKLYVNDCIFNIGECKCIKKT